MFVLYECLKVSVAASMASRRRHRADYRNASMASRRGRLDGVEAAAQSRDDAIAEGRSKDADSVPWFASCWMFNPIMA